MKQIFKKFFLDYVSGEKLEIVYVFSFFMFFVFTVLVVLAHNDILQSHNSRASNSMRSHSSILEAADKDIAEDIDFSEEKNILETPEVQEAENTPTEEPKEAIIAFPKTKTLPPVKTDNKNKYVIASKIKTPTLSEFKKDGEGRRVCEDRGDDPRVSYQNGSIHIDKECCLDPDEIPNPRCYYSPKKYGKLLEKYEKNKAKFLKRYRKSH